MKLLLDFRREAKRDFDEAFDWYQKQRLGLGTRFAEVVEKELNQIAEQPLTHGIVHSSVRCGLVKKFPYGVYYQCSQIALKSLRFFTVIGIQKPGKHASTIDKALCNFSMSARPC